MHELFVVDVTRGYLPAALLTAAAQAREGAEVLLVHGSQDQEVVRRAVERFHPSHICSMSGCTPALSPRGGESIAVTDLPHESAALLSWLIHEAAEIARGAVLFPAGSPSWAIKAAALATRLGYLAWPLEEAAGLAYAAPPDIPLVVLGEAPGALSDRLQGREFQHLPGDRALAQFLIAQGHPVDYVVLLNSADLEPPAYTGGSMGTTWVRGLSLLAPLLASYRNALVLDARTPRPDPLEIERTLNQKVHDVGLRPQHLAILASPGAIPFIHEPHLPFGPGEDPTRDLHLRLNDDLYFDCAEGRLFGQTAGKVSLQLLSTKHYKALPGNFRRKALIFNRPHVEAGVTFAIDEAVGRTQLRPLLEKAGLTVTELYDKDCSPRQIAEYLPDAGLMMYGGHGHPEALSTHEAPLYAEFLPPEIAPGVVYACACSTMYPRPNRYTADGGFSFDEEATPFAEQIGPAFVDRGALAFVGGLTVEDVLLNTPMYVAFMQALVLKGMSVGEAVRAARNHTLTHLAVLSQKAPGAYANYRSSLANTIQQQILLGDPAFRPYEGTKAAQLPMETRQSEESLQLTLRLPAERWVRQSVAVEKGKPNKEFHRARNLEAWHPVGEDVFNWGESYTVAKDATDESEKGVLSSYIHLTADLPEGRVPVSLTLAGAESYDQECLLCGHTHEVTAAVARFSKYVVPFQDSEPPVAHDHEKGWAFTVEEIPGGLRVHWLLPALVVEDASRQAIRLASAVFRLEHRPGTRVEGRLELEGSAGGADAPGAMEGTRGRLPADLLLSFGADQVVAQTLSGPGGRWSCWLPTGAEMPLRVDLPMPVFRHTAEAAALAFTPDTVPGIQVSGGLVTARLKAPGTGTLRGTVIDAYTGRPLPGAKVRLWRGKNGSKFPVYEGYVGETRTDAQGHFAFTVPPGSYLAATAYRSDLRYFAGKAAATVYQNRQTPVLVAMEPGALLSGRLSFDGPYQPKHAGIRLLEHGAKEESVLAAGTARRDGRFEILVPTTKPFVIKVQPEGYVPLIDDNGGQGYHLSPGEELTRELALQGE